MQKMSQTEEMAKMLAGRARRHVLTPEQVSRAMEEQDFDPAGLDELYAALEMRGVQFIHPDNPADAWPGWGGGACAGLWPRSGAPAPG